jgi:hypothetical protein
MHDMHTELHENQSHRGWDLLVCNVNQQINNGGHLVLYTYILSAIE